MKRYILPLLLIAILFTTLWSCGQKEQICSELGQPKYPILDSNDPLDHLIFKIKEETGLQLVYHFDPGAAQWNLGKESSVATARRYVPFNNPAERQALLSGVQQLEQDFLSAYPLKLKREFFPLRIFLCDSIVRGKKDFSTFSGRDHLAINLLSSKETDTKGDYKEKQVAELHQRLWGYIFTYQLKVPETFLSYSSEWYDQNVVERKDPEADPRAFGFWEWQDETIFYPGKFFHTKREGEEVTDFILRMVTMTEEEIEKAIGNYDIMRSKYIILRNYIKEATGIDIQEIGNKTK